MSVQCHMQMSLVYESLEVVLLGRLLCWAIVLPHFFRTTLTMDLFLESCSE
ncbi:hypothetical protein CRYUN_Cryun09bG0128700 [Craigia yunnanensis]